MSTVIPAGDSKIKPINEHGYSKTLQRIIASQKEGCNHLSMRILTIRPNGHTTRIEKHTDTVYYILDGSVLFMDSDGLIHNLKKGDTVILLPFNRHNFRNDTDSDVHIMAVSAI